MNYSIPGWMSNRDLEILSYLSSCVPEYGNILELGCFLGRSTSALVQSKKDNVSIDVVDTFTGIPVTEEYLDISGDRELFNEMRSEAIKTGDWEQSFKFCQGKDLHKINLFKCSSQNFKIEKHYDLSFIDTTHTFREVFFDIKKFINVQGIIAGDDFTPKWDGVAKAVNVFQCTFDKTLVVPRGSKIWMLVPNDTHWTNSIKQII